MAISIGSSTSAYAAYGGLQSASAAQAQASKRLSSGTKLGSAADDPSGLSISNQLLSSIRGMQAASGNAQDGIGLIQTADGALGQTTDQLQHIRELTVQAAGTTDPGALQAIGAEVTQTLASIDQTSKSAAYGSQSLLDGSLASGVNFQTGSSGGAANQQTISIPDSGQSSLGLSGLAASILGGYASSALSSVDDAIQTVTSTRSDLGSTQNALMSTVNDLAVNVVNEMNANSQIADTDIAQESMNSSAASIRSQISTALMAQTNQLNQSHALALLR